MDNQNLLQPIFHFSSPLEDAADGSKPKPGAELAGRIGKLLEQFSDNEKFAPAIVVMPIGSETYADAISESCIQPTFLAVPPCTGDATAALLASLAKPVRLRCRFFALIPAEIALEGSQNLAALVHQAHLGAQASGKSVIFARRAGSQDRDIAFETLIPDQRTNLLTVHASGRADNSDRFGVAMEMGQLYCANGPIVLSETALFDAAKQYTTAVISSCSSAIAVARRQDRILFPNAGFLSLVPGQHLVELLAHRPGTLLIHSGGELFKSENTGKIAVVSELPDLNQPCEEVGQEYARPWGSERLISLEEETRISRLAIRPANKAVRIPSQQLIHWTVLSGTAFAKAGGDLRTVSAGENVEIAPGDKHAITNIGKTDLVVYEISMPAPVTTEQKPAARYG